MKTSISTIRHARTAYNWATRAEEWERALEQLSRRG